MKLTAQQIQQAKSPKGGYTRAQLKALGVGWPPPKGWTKKQYSIDQIEDFVEVKLHELRVKYLKKVAKTQAEIRESAR